MHISSKQLGKQTRSLKSMTGSARMLGLGALCCSLLTGAAAQAAVDAGKPGGTTPGATAGTTDTAGVLAKLHHANQMEVEMGKAAQDKGQSKDVKAFGKTLVTDHSAADKKVMALAKDEKIDLPATMAPMPDDKKMETLKTASGADFDKAFSQAMLDDHEKDVGEAKMARDGTTDPKLKKLLTATIPVLEKHRATAKKLVDKTASEAKK
jgi:putative membrane protein